MKKYTVIFIICGLVIFTSCIHGTANNERTEPESVSEGNPEQVVLSNHHSIDSFTILLEDSFIFFSFDDSCACFYRQYYISNEMVKIGEIDNYVFDMGQYARIDHRIYFYMTIGESMNDIMDTNQYENILYYIDTDSNTLGIANTESKYLPGAIIDSIGGFIVSRQSQRSQENLLSTFIELYDTKTGHIQNGSEVFVLDDNRNVGKYIMNMCTDEKYIYALVDERFENGSNNTFVYQYDIKNFDLINKLTFSNVPSDFFMWKSGNMYVYRDCLYVSNYANESVVCTIHDDMCEKIAHGYGVQIAILSKKTESPIFYQKGGNTIYVYEEDKNMLLLGELDLLDDYTVNQIMKCGDQVLIALFKYPSTAHEEDLWRIYVVDERAMNTIH